MPKEESDRALVVTRYGQLRRERAAIREAFAWFEKELAVCRARIAELENDEEPRALTDEEIEKADPHSFFKDPRD